MANPSYLEKELLERIAEGDEMAFAELYRAYYPQLKPLIGKANAAGVDADDILQAAFLKIWLHRSELPGIADLKPWIFKVTYREFLTAIRSKMRYNDRLNGYATAGENHNDPPSPLQAVNFQEMKLFVQDIINALPERRRIIYQMSREEGLKIAEIAEKLAISTNTVKSTLQTVLHLLREQLTKAGYDPLLVIFFLNFFILQ